MGTRDTPAGHSVGTRTERPHHPDGWIVPRDESTETTKAMPDSAGGWALGGRKR